MIVNYVRKDYLTVPTYVGYDSNEVIEAVSRNANFREDVTGMYYGKEIHAGHKSCVAIRYEKAKDVTIVAIKDGDNKRVFYALGDYTECVIYNLDPICPGPDNDRFNH